MERLADRISLRAAMSAVTRSAYAEERLRRKKRGATVNKGAITVLSLAAILLNVIAFVGFGPAVATQLFGCRSSLYGPPATGCAAYSSRDVTVGIALSLGGVLAAVAAWIMGLAKTAQIRRWGWFAAVLLIPPLGSLLYGLAGPTTKSTP